MAIKKSELYSSLWSSCDLLRGGMDASQYKDYVLVLLFIKYISDKYAGQPKDCLDYIVLHEMVHLLEPKHGERFVALMDRFMPKWEFIRQKLNRLPVSHTDWDY